ncbi:MAG TPA: M23 family metallopeptidase [Candidatus Paceibacterota bacterium]|nr:M23 family metallopeptidase [Candidatus Paceibacterota bacterium]
MIVIPLSANANGLTDLVKTVFGGVDAQADENATASGQVVRNSQTLALLESSIDPDIKNSINSNDDEIIVQDDSFIYSNGLFGSDNTGMEKSPLSDKIYVYTVKKGDTLSEIAESFDVSMNTIKWENNLSGGTISVGQKLNILPVTGVKHIVKSGDTVSKIADKYEAETEDILIFNDIAKGETLKKGDIIFVPNGIIKTVAPVKPTSSGSSTTVVSNTKVASGYYLRPVAGIITSPYGSRRGGFHYGVDIGNKRGTPVMAAASGTVVEVVSGCKEGVKSCGGRYGNHIIIQHSNNTRTFYAHLSKASVSVGQSVSQGDIIGALGNTGRSTGPHLHFEIENSNGSKMRPVF